MEGIAVESTGGVPIPDRPQATPVEQVAPPETPSKAPTRSTTPEPLKTVQTPEKAEVASSTKRVNELENLKAEIAKLSNGQGSKTDVTIRFDDTSKEPIITVTDRESGRVLKEFPPSELRKVRALLSDLAGIIVNEKA